MCRRPHSYAQFLRAITSVLLFGAIGVGLVSVLDRPAGAQTFTVIHNFTGGSDGAEPISGLTIGRDGNLYGTTNEGGQGTCGPQNAGCGTVFELKRVGSAWNLIPIYRFLGEPDGGGPYGRVVVGPDGSLYGTTVAGGSNNCLSGCGTVYSVKPPATIACKTALCLWHETVLYSFQGGSDAYYPTGDVAFDSAGNMYGTTYVGGPNGPGAVWKLAPSGGHWTESLAHSFTGSGSDGGNPYGGVVFDNNGNMYGASPAGALSDNGAAWELSPSGSSWMEQGLHEFMGGNDGSSPVAGLLFAGGNLFGSAQLFGQNNGGTVFELKPSGSGWTYSKISDLPNGQGPFARLVADSAGNLYGTTEGGNIDYGTVFKLTPSGAGWILTVLHRFTGGSDGSTPMGSVVVDASGNIYGTTVLGGSVGFGVVFEITP